MRGDADRIRTGDVCRALRRCRRAAWEAGRSGPTSPSTSRAGEFVAILGPNGVGKSTLVKAALGLVPLCRRARPPCSGAPRATPGRDIGYLPQTAELRPGLRVRGIDVVRLGSDGERWGVPLPGLARFSRARRRANERVDEVIELVGAAAFAGRPIGHVSGGEQQRLLIAQALVRRPQLLVLDEPLDSLDLPNQAAVAALVSTDLPGTRSSPCCWWRTTSTRSSRTSIGSSTSPEVAPSRVRRPR